MADAESSCRPQEQGAENVEDSDLDPETTEPTVTQPDISNTKPASGSWFTFDDVPIIKQRERLHTFSAWIDLQLSREGATLSKVLKEFASRFIGTLRDWFQSLGDYRQVQFSQATNPSIVLGAIHQEFIGDASLINKMASQEYFTMKCCSLKRKDLDFYFKRMSEKFYMLNGLNDPNLKHVFLASLPQELQLEIQRMIASTRKDVAQLSLGPWNYVVRQEKLHWTAQHRLFRNEVRRRKYQPGPHITQELLKFPEENLTVKEIQQFLGIVNYIKDFIPQCSLYTSQLSKLLKKEPPSWGQTQTMALQKLKQVCQQPIPLKIPSTGHRILQTDASNEFWGAILIEEENGKKHFCGHASGQFKDSEKHYHAVYKEILAIKYGIKKFEFHLIGHHFTILMDNTSFPKIMDLKNKGVPEPQLLRLKDWFFKYQFTVKHIKGENN
ncbi:UNVERIFIED_CONTAM: polyprotein [Sesamum latifolium]|uniref:Polyprotein n=1 Tax=Sesamum latifolium TaxID=2727402 RepID=A0AAW2UVD1_9LAMI